MLGLYQTLKSILHNLVALCCGKISQEIHACVCHRPSMHAWIITNSKSFLQESMYESCQISLPMTFVSLPIISLSLEPLEHIMHACHINCIAGLVHFLCTSVIKQSKQIPFLLKVKIPTSYLLESFFPGILVPIFLWEKPAMSGKNEWAAGINLPSLQEDNLGVAQYQLHKLQICFVASESQFFLKFDIVHLTC